MKDEAIVFKLFWGGEERRFQKTLVDVLQFILQDVSFCLLLKLVEWHCAEILGNIIIKAHQTDAVGEGINDIWLIIGIC